MIHLKTTCRFTKPSLTSPFLLIHQLSFLLIKTHTVHLLDQSLLPLHPFLTNKTPNPDQSNPLTSLIPPADQVYLVGGFQNHVEVLLVQPLPDFNAS